MKISTIKSRFSGTIIFLILLYLKQFLKLPNLKEMMLNPDGNEAGFKEAAGVENT